MFNYPNGKTLMNTVIWLIGALEFLVGLLVVVSSFVPAIEGLTQSGVDQIPPMFAPMLVHGLQVVGVVILVSSFPTLMFAEISMKVNQTNKMTRKIYDRLRS